MLKTSRWIQVVVGGLLLLAAHDARADDKYKLEEPVDDVRIFGVGTRVDISGKLQTAPKSPHLSQTVSAALSYRERRMLGPGSEAEALRSVREYETAQADIDVDGNKTALRLPDALKLIVAQGRTSGVELYALSGLLTATELDLIRSPADSLALIGLLPKNEVSVGEQWTVPDWSFQMLTGLDAVVKGELTCTLESVEKGTALVKLNGTLEGAAVGSSTEVKVNGFYKYNLEGKYIRESDFLQSETRAVGPVSPGLDISARIRLLRQPVTAAGRLSDQKIIDQSVLEAPDSQKFLRFESPWNIGIKHSRRWSNYKVDEKLAVFRLLDEGNFIAQCDMAAIPSAKPGEHLPDQVFLNDIQHSLGDRLRKLSPGEVVPSTEHKYVYKTRADGVVGERQVTWVFYLVADPSGRQVSMMFTVDTEAFDKLSPYDREIVDSLKFGPAPAPRAANK